MNVMKIDELNQEEFSNEDIFDFENQNSLNEDDSGDSDNYDGYDDDDNGDLDDYDGYDEDDNEDSVDYNDNDWEKDTFDALTDGQYGSYEDFNENGGDMGYLRDILGL